MSISSRWSRRGVHALVVACASGLTSLATAVPACAQGDLAISRVDVVQQTAGEVAVTWQVTGSDPALTGFEVTRAEGGPAVSIATTGPAARTASDPLTGVTTGGHLFTYMVIAHAGAGVITSLAVSPGTIYKGVPSAPTGIDIATLGAVVTLHWQPPVVNAALLDHYAVQRRIDGGAFGPDPASPIAPSPTPALVETVPGLTTGGHEVEYIITSFAAAGAGGEIQFLASAFVGVPNWPASVGVRMGFDGTSAVITWTAPTQNPGLVTGYRIVRTVAGVETDLGTVGADVRSDTDPSLGPIPAGTSVTYTVTALAGANDGGAAPGFVTVDHTQLPFATAPTVTARPGSLDVRWVVPETGGIPVTTYHLRYRATGAAAWIAVAQQLVDSATRHAVISSLSASTTYEVQVSAVDPAGAGTSGWSPSGSATTPAGGGGGPHDGGHGGELPATGASPGPLALVGLAITATGMALLLLARRVARRRRSGSGTSLAA